MCLRTHTFFAAQTNDFLHTYAFSADVFPPHSCAEKKCLESAPKAGVGKACVYASEENLETVWDWYHFLVLCGRSSSYGAASTYMPASDLTKMFRDSSFKFRPNSRSVITAWYQ